MGVNIDKTGGNHMAGCVNGLAGITTQAADSDDPITPDPYVCLHAGLTGTIDNRSVPNNDVVAHA